MGKVYEKSRTNALGDLTWLLREIDIFQKEKKTFQIK